MRASIRAERAEPSIRATQKLIDTLGWYKATPQIEVVTVHLPAPRVGGMHADVSERDIERYYAEESAEMLAASLEDRLHAARTR